MNETNEKLEGIIKLFTCSKERSKMLAEQALGRGDLRRAAVSFFAAGMEEKAIVIARKAEQTDPHIDFKEHQIKQAALYAALGIKEDFVRIVEKCQFSRQDYLHDELKEWIRAYMPFRRLFD